MIPFLAISGSRSGWDISEAAYASKSFSVGAQEVAPQDLAFKPDGTKMYVGGGNDIVYQYTLSTPWDVSTASYDSKSLSVAAQESSLSAFDFSADGTKMYALGPSND